jgi:UDP-glucuronate 4-epimerase
MKILVTGSAGFIGFYLAQRLMDRGDDVTGIDSLNDYYDVRLKYARLAQCGINEADVAPGRESASKIGGYRFLRLNMEDRDGMERLFGSHRFDAVCNLAAQAGVRYSLENPHAYIDSNIAGFMNVLEGCRHGGVSHLVYASSSSVYGLNESTPFGAGDNVDHPVSLYAATKKANELMAHSYSHLYGVPATGLRFFTVYGPWGRPDMAYFKFTKAILEGKAIDVYNNGDMARDFTYIDDIVEGLVRIIDSPPKGNASWDGARPDPASSPAPCRVYNIGNDSPVRLLDFIGAIEAALGMKAKKNLLPMQPGDVPVTWADVSPLERDFGYRPETPLEEGIERFVRWYREFYGV